MTKIIKIKKTLKIMKNDKIIEKITENLFCLILLKNKPYRLMFWDRYLHIDFCPTDIISRVYHSLIFIIR